MKVRRYEEKYDYVEVRQETSLWMQAKNVKDLTLAFLAFPISENPSRKDGEQAAYATPAATPAATIEIKYK